MNGTLTGADVRNRSLTPRDLEAGSLPAGPAGPAGLRGDFDVDFTVLVP